MCREEPPCTTSDRPPRSPAPSSRSASTSPTRPPSGDDMELDLTGRVAIVTGASKGIGLAITTLLAEEGVHVYAGARGASDELTALGETGLVEFVEVDL